MSNDQECRPYAEVHAEFCRRFQELSDYPAAYAWYKEQFDKGLVIMPETEYREDAPPDLGRAWNRPRI